jgi:hypothetical protein
MKMSERKPVRKCGICSLLNINITCLAAESEEEFDFSPSATVKIAQRVLGFDDIFAQTLLQNLNTTDEDPILLLVLNQTWVNIHGIRLANRIADRIAKFDMPRGQRRDSKENCHRIAFRFRDMDEIARCRRHILQTSQQAFAFSADAVATGVLPANAATVSMARTLVIMKIAVRQDDVSPYNFFDF